MKTTIKNFTGADEIEIDAHIGTNEKTVMLRQRGSSMYFQINLSATGARLMAAALIAAANEITGIAP